jgi:hypothetical protein
MRHFFVDLTLEIVDKGNNLNMLPAMCMPVIVDLGSLRVAKVHKKKQIHYLGKQWICFITQQTQKV